MEKIFPKKSLGQNFLIDGNIARKIISLLKISSGDVIVEIGPGKGILTHFFCDCKNEVYAVELDDRCVKFLKNKFKDCSNITIVHQDFLDWDSNINKKTEQKIKWIGNLPYNISSSVLFKLIELYPGVQKVVVMVQKEVAERIVASHGNKNYGILSVLLQTFYKTKKQFNVSRNVFRPKPKVDSSIITLELIRNIQIGCELQLYLTVIKKAFNQRRKLLSNSLNTLFSQRDIEEIPFEFHRRAEEVSIEEWKTLSQYLHPKMIQN